MSEREALRPRADAAPGLADYASRIAPLAPDDTVQAALARFRAEKGRGAIPVVFEGAPVGVLARCRFVEWLARSRDEAGVLDQPVTRAMNPQPLLLPATTPVFAAAEALDARGEAGVREGIVLTRAGTYAGHVTARALMTALRRLSQHSVQPEPAPAPVPVRSEAEQGAMLSAFAHEIRTPLSGMMGLASLLETARLDDETKKLVQTLLQQGRAMNRLLDNLIDMGRLGAGAVTLQPVETDLEQMIAELGTVWGATANAKRVTLRADFAGTGPALVKVDAVRLRQIADNLLGNAVKFTDEGRITLSLETIRFADHVLVRLLVSDTGPGISRDLADRLFRPFAQARSGPASRKPGSGLGLSIVQGLAEAMGGRVWHEAAPDRGSVFAAEVRAEAVVGEVSRGEAVRARSGEFRLGRVLVAEDHPVNRMVIERALKAAGWQADMVETGAHALRRGRERPYQAVLLDLNLPEISGLDVARALRKPGSAVAGAPILAVTASTSAEDRAACLEAGFDGLIEKPIEPKALIARLADEIINRAQGAVGMKQAG